MSEIIINEAAAQNDISNLENAKNTLRDAASAVTKLMNTSAQMQGQTGNAIQTKASLKTAIPKCLTSSAGI